MVCRLSVEHNGNYKNDSDHDSNTRKFWFLVFGKGLYTKKTDADVAAVGAITAYTYSTPARGLSVPPNQGPAAHQSDADSDTDKDTEEPRARARVLDRVARQVATAPRKASKTVNREVVVKSERLASTARAALTPVKHGDDTDDDDLFKSDSTDEDVTMPLSHPVARSRPPSALCRRCHHQLGRRLKLFVHFPGFSRHSTPHRRTLAGPSASRATASAHMLFNRITRVLYDDPKSAFAEKSPGESMQVVDAREIITVH
ncbi:hypothetical protein B0H14DRAFT_3534873 [Mycena olivaceomarginata]|nr:hypothetical protein B0H14DRAFT_3534873 [Mycena olivaceomarginata]